MGFNYSFDHGNSIFFVYGEDGFDEIGPKLEEYLNDPRWHYGETQMLGSWMGRKFAVLSWEEIQLIVDTTRFPAVSASASHPLYHENNPSRRQECDFTPDFSIRGFNRHPTLSALQLLNFHSVTNCFRQTAYLPYNRKIPN